MTRLAALFAVTTAGAAACVGTIGGDDSPGNDPLVRQTTPAPGGLRRLTARQYIATVRALLGDGAAAVATPPEDAQLHGLDAIGSAELALGVKGVAQYEESARAIAEVLWQSGQLAALLPCTPSGVGDEACFASFARELGRLLWRRPLDAAEIDQLAAVGVASATHPDVNDFYAGAAELLSTLLQSPYFVYAVEIGVPEPSDPKKRWLDGYELVTRMSLFLYGRAPDAGLLDAAETRNLRDAGQVEALAREMLADEEAEDAFAEFFDELYRLRELSAIGKDSEAYPTWNATLATSMRLETLYLLNDVVWGRDADARELFTASHTFVDGPLAAHYGMAPVATFARVALPVDQGRAGMVGHASWLTRLSHPATTSPTRRGLFVRTALLCDEVPPPPPGVSTELPTPSEAPKTKKQQLLQHQQDPQCASCHVLIDNIGLALEHYDAIGGYRATDGALPIDSASDTSDLGAFASAAELGARLAEDPRSMQCLMKSLFRGAMGHLETEGEQASLDALEQAFIDSGYRVRELLVQLTASPAFRLVADPK